MKLFESKSKFERVELEVVEKGSDSKLGVKRVSW